MKNYDENCIFCKITNGYINCYKVYEDDDVLAFLDVNPVSYGHTLVVPKAHFSSFLATPKDIMNKVMNVAQRIGQIQVEKLNAKGVNILSNCGEAAGQTVHHFHVHVIPRYNEKDGLIMEFKSIDNLQLPAIADSIKINL